jgi:hypothetical protein
MLPPARTHPTHPIPRPCPMHAPCTPHACPMQTLRLLKERSEANRARVGGGPWGQTWNAGGIPNVRTYAPRAPDTGRYTWGVPDTGSCRRIAQLRPPATCLSA